MIQSGSNSFAAPASRVVLFTREGDLPNESLLIQAVRERDYALDIIRDTATLMGLLQRESVTKTVLLLDPRPTGFPAPTGQPVNWNGCRDLLSFATTLYHLGRLRVIFIAPPGMTIDSDGPRHPSEECIRHWIWVPFNVSEMLAFIRHAFDQWE
jgi:hypothetical protein